MEKSDVYDKHEIFLKEIVPIIKKLKIACNLNKLPMFITVAVANDESGTQYESDAIHASTELNLKDDRIANLMLLLNGFEADMPEYIQKDIFEIHEYFKKCEEIRQADQIPVTLTDDKICLFHKTTVCGDHVKPPRKITEKPITDEFLDD